MLFPYRSAGHVASAVSATVLRLSGVPKTDSWPIRPIYGPMSARDSLTSAHVEPDGLLQASLGLSTGVNQSLPPR